MIATLRCGAPGAHGGGQGALCRIWTSGLLGYSAHTRMAKHDIAKRYHRFEVEAERFEGEGGAILDPINGTTVHVLYSTSSRDAATSCCSLGRSDPPTLDNLSGSAPATKVESKAASD